MGLEAVPSLSSQNVVAILLARGGSKGLPRKNILPLAGKPLLAYSIEAANRSRHVNRVIVSTDDEEIASVAREYGAEVPFLRPAKLADDLATSEVALKHAVEWLRDNEGYETDIVVYLQVTDLYRTPAMIDQCVEALLTAPQLDSAFMGHIEHKNFWRQQGDAFVRLADDIPYGVPRQEKEPLFREDTGTACATRASVVLSGRRLGERCKVIPYEQDIHFIDIHTEFDFWLAEMLIDRYEFD